MSAAAHGTTADYSKGVRSGREGFATLRAIAAGLALLGVALLVVAEFSTVLRVVVGSLEIEKRTTTGGDNHGYALLVVAVCALPALFFALRGARPAAAALAALGAAALVVALAIDLPDTRESGRLPESVAFEDARAQAGPGLRLEVAGGVALVLAGIALSVAPGRPARGVTRAPRAGRVTPTATARTTRRSSRSGASAARAAPPTSRRRSRP